MDPMDESLDNRTPPSTDDSGNRLQNIENAILSLTLAVEQIRANSVSPGFLTPQGSEEAGDIGQPKARRQTLAGTEMKKAGIAAKQYESERAHNYTFMSGQASFKKLPALPESYLPEQAGRQAATLYTEGRVLGAGSLFY